MSVVLAVVLSVWSYPGLRAADCVSSSQEPSALVEFTRSGGYAGWIEQLVVRHDGTARAERTAGPAAENDFTVPDNEWAELEQELRAAHFDRMKPHYRRDMPYADGYWYSTTYEGRTVSCDQDSGPEELRRVNAHLEQLMSEALSAADQP